MVYLTCFDRLGRWEEIAVSLLRKYCDRYYKYRNRRAACRGPGVSGCSCRSRHGPPCYCPWRVPGYAMYEMNKDSSDCAATTDAALERLLERYARSEKAITVNFRRLASCLSAPDRATHLIHSYPAKLLMHIPYFFLANTILSRPGDLVLDPFCGSG